MPPVKRDASGSKFRVAYHKPTILSSYARVAVTGHRLDASDVYHS